jgi:hypothetical protein
MWWSVDPEKDWAKAQPWIKAALAQLDEGFTAQDIFQMIQRREVELIMGAKSAMVVEGRKTPKLNILHIWLAGGDLDELKEGEKKFSQEWRQIGFNRICITGRVGWKKALPDYTQTAILLSKEL